MDEFAKIFTIEKSDSAEHISYIQSTSSNYIQYQTSTSLMPYSLDQVMKNAVLVYDDSPIEITE